MGKNRLNPIKTRRPNTPETKVSDLDKINTNIEAPVVVKACDRFGLLCPYCEQNGLHPSPQELDWSRKDWDRTKAKRKEETKETNLVSDWDLPKPQPNINQKTHIDRMDFSKLHIGQNDPKEEQVEVTKSLIPLPKIDEKKAPKEMTEKTDNELTKVEKRNQQEEEKYAMYQRAYTGQLSEEEESNMDSDYSESGYFK